MHMNTYITIIIRTICASFICTITQAHLSPATTRTSFNKKISPVLIYILNLNNTNRFDTQEIAVRVPQPTDIKQLIEVDRAVSFEFFEPLYEKFYSQYDFGKRPHYYLELELAADEVLFRKILFESPDINTKVIIAHNQEQTILGFIIISLIDTHETEIDLLLVKKEFRAKHAGKYLIQAALKLFPTTTACNVYPFRFGNDATLKFYEKIGFRNMGLGPATRINPYGIGFQELYFHYRYTLT